MTPMSRALRMAPACLLVCLATACAAPGEEESEASSSALACNDEQLQQCKIYGGVVKGHMRPGAEAAASEILDPGLTTQALVDALGWLATHHPPPAGLGDQRHQQQSPLRSACA